MQRLKKIIVIFLLVVVLLYCGVHLFALLKGRGFVENTLQKLTNKKVKIGYLYLNAFLNLEIKNIEIDGLASIEKILLKPTTASLLTGTLFFKTVKIIRPEFTFEISSSEIAELPKPEVLSEAPAAALTIPLAPPEIKRRFPSRIIFKEITLEKGLINFIDHALGEEGIKVIVKDIEVNVSNLYAFPVSILTNFQLNGRMPWKGVQEEGQIEMRGWIDLFKKDMQASLRIKDIDGIYLYPYYALWVDLEKARIESVKLNFSSNIQGLNNDLTAQCRLELVDIVRRERLEDEPAQKAAKLTDVILGMLRTMDEGKIVLEFNVDTKMDKPEFGFDTIKSAFEKKLAQAQEENGFHAKDALMLPVKILEGMVKGATEVSKAVVDGTFAVGNELKKSVQETFRKGKKSE